VALQQVANLTQFGNELSKETGVDAGITDSVIKAGGQQGLASVLSRLDTASGRATGAFDSAEGTLNRQQRALGQSMSESEQRVQKRRLGLGRALASVDARNREVGNIRARTDFARSSAVDLRSVAESQVLSGRTQLAGAEANREAQYQQDLAKYKADKAAGLGQLVGIGLSFVPGGQFLAPAAQQAVTKAAM
jgi:hypothetical protein